MSATSSCPVHSIPSWIMSRTWAAGLAHGAGDHSGLAEAAARVQPRNTSTFSRSWTTSVSGTTEGRIRPVGQVGDRALHTSGARRSRARWPPAAPAVPRRVERGTSTPSSGARGLQRVRGRTAGLGRGDPHPHDLGELADQLLAVARREGVDEVGQGLGVEGAVASRDHQRGRPLARSAACQWESRQVDEVDHVGVDEFGREVERQHVEGRRRQVLLDAEERHAGSSAWRPPCRPRVHRRARRARRDAR